MPEFRAAYFSRDYEATLAFYRQGLELPVVESWDRGRDERGTIFQVGDGRIEILALPTVQDGNSSWDYRTPAGVTMVIEVEDAAGLCERLTSKGLPIREKPKLQPWGHRSFVLTDPDGVVLYFFTDESR